MTQQNLTQFFDTTSNKRKPDGPDDNGKTTVTPPKKEENTRTNAKEHFNNLRQLLLRRWSYVFNIIQTLNLPGCTMKFSPGLG